MVENVLILLLFLGALAYLGNLVRKAFRRNTAAGCPKGCGTCAAQQKMKKPTALANLRTE
jgi:hypothetical protein